MSYLVQDKIVVVLGLARSGVAAVSFLLEKGAFVRATDVQYEIQGLEELKKEPRLELYLGEHPLTLLSGVSLLVISPGVDENIPFVHTAKELNIPIISEFELATSFISKPLIAVTGTNGKTTTTTLIGEIMKTAGVNCVVAGNIGQAACLEIENINQAEAGVLEVSSFQLTRSETFHPRIALILNITPDHLDRHPTMEDYAASKAKIFQNQTSRDQTILNYDEPLTRSLAEQSLGEVYFISLENQVERGMFIKDEWLVFKDNKGVEKKIISVNEIVLAGLHNRENFLAAALAAVLWGVDNKAIAKTAGSFKGLAHRLETVAVIDGVTYINDSKGTNVDSVRKSLLSYQDASVILIMGGRDKGSDFTPLIPLVKEKVKLLLLIGEAAPKLTRVFNGICPLMPINTMAEAASRASENSVEGDVALLSPGCTSWDMFKDYKERGELFRQAVEELEVNKNV